MEHLDPTQSRLNERIADYQRAYAQLSKALAQPEDEFIRDSVIQRFEFTYELAWKMLKLRLTLDGIDAKTPRETLQESLQAGFITDGNGWSELQLYRNRTSHTYDLNLAQTVYQFIQTHGIKRFDELAAQASTWSHP
ncbi:MAG: HI0074 family nucleotidyltransferase substrate-binding subunit [Formosimonas sp.]